MSCGHWYTRKIRRCNRHAVAIAINCYTKIKRAARLAQTLGIKFIKIPWTLRTRQAAKHIVRRTSRCAVYLYARCVISIAYLAVTIWRYTYETAHSIMTLARSVTSLTLAFTLAATYHTETVVRGVFRTWWVHPNSRRTRSPPPRYISRTIASSTEPTEALPDEHLCKRDSSGTTLAGSLRARALLSSLGKKTKAKSKAKPSCVGGPRRGSALMRLATMAIWLIMDSGCTYHCHPTASDLVSQKQCLQHMIAADGSRHRTTLIGDMPLAARDRHGKLRRILLRNVRCVPNFTDTLISVDQLWEDSSVEARFAGVCAICLPTQAGHCAMDLPFVRCEGLFQWAVIPSCRTGEVDDSRADESSRCLAAKIHRARTNSHLNTMPASEAAAVLHRRLHINAEYLKRLPELTSDAPDKLRSADISSCEHCTIANATHVPHKGQRYKSSHVGRLVHGDIVGPFKRSHDRGYQYMLVLIDDHSRFLGVRLLRRKSEALSGVRVKYVALWPS